ncbi:methyltransferase domain-containing protein [Granulosicoccus antarcticus]|uniref:Ubiquinone biosynthesis O-methyltransferase n=1 Tax=Granulosicoccus antarcticus IMCC3135 TaxID=1192854 RepID=A0A2Z2P125_9GAMM|nr:methyltransferase domain-containing protein [Granulosicoccus antarcticus]ASJ75868.1 Ubiquinone biosynthesis O-methyltransferase [Granulosicoccus antarcticus IMCC3135]
MKQHISAPAPRMLLRLIQLMATLEQQNLMHTSQARFCEIGPGLGDASSLALDCFDIQEAHLYEDAAAARSLLEKRFTDQERVLILDSFRAKPDYYNLVMCFEVIEHIEHDQTFIDSIFTSMQTDGHFLGSVPAYMSKWQDVDELAGHFRRYERQELQDKLEAAGFTDVHLYPYGFPLINLLYPLRKLYYSGLLRKRQQTDMATATAKSGISRGLAKSFNTSFVLCIVRFFSLFQSIPYLSRLGDGFVFTCRKP